ncbi:hypothetical protein A5482_014705 (plasmid) [Cyanobacterium sp. IPPAS B-1200]|uniref:hypothetical protein n=1 Tax=Cyanobacterium sp. IPPAS B-1200 TaxID=1562720 RepID=UPI00085288D2|nr:hypothetical protein [Cyanobacterium sp. IPPAS B-1200]OEJ78148.1 hypothetical protein A5482_14015 [Cyanobacterium sp. IPPAS B-1200]
MDIRFVVTTRNEVLEAINSEYQIVMVDGTVPNFQLRETDLHFDHHRQGGKAVQIDEIPSNLSLENKICFVTTQVDADATVAGAYILLQGNISVANLSKLRAIAWDCDHLFVPDELAEYRDFASQAVAGMKANSNSLVRKLGLPKDRKLWSIEDKELYATKAFEQGVYHLIDACKGARPFPGESGEARTYWEGVEKNTRILKEQNRVTEYNGSVIIDYCGLEGYIDPRCALRIVQSWEKQPQSPITLSRRDIYRENKFLGVSYTIGCIPWHPNIDDLDYTRGTFDALTQAEVLKGGDAEINKSTTHR